MTALFNVKSISRIMKNVYLTVLLTLLSYALFAQCAGINPDCNILSDFECQTNYVGLPAVANPAPDAVNMSSDVGEYNDTPDAFNALIIDFRGPRDLSVFNILKLKVYTTVAGSGNLLAKLEAGSSPPSPEQSSPITVGAWTEYTFDFSGQATANHQQLTLILNAGQNFGGTYFVDDIRWTDNGSATDPCMGVTPDPLILNDFECQQNEPFETCFPIVDNPGISAVNSSAKVGRYVDTGGQFDNIAIDFDAPIDFSTNNQIKIAVRTSVAKQLVVKAEGGTSPGREVGLTTGGTGDWEELCYDFSGAAAENHTRLVFFFNFNASDGAGDIYFIDNIRFAAVLPVEMTRFTAAEKGGQVNLQWQTATETNSAGFVIEHATRNTDFTKIGYVRAAGESFTTKNYAFTHIAPVSGQNLYRLRSEDLDGSFAYSEIIKIDLAKGEKNLVVAPNPFTQDLNFTVKTTFDEAADFYLYDMNGKILVQRSLAFTKVENGYTAALPDGLQTGAYLVKLVTAREVYSRMVLKN